MVSGLHAKKGIWGDFMQYYNRFLKKSGRSSDENRVICLNQIVTFCAEKALALYPCKLSFSCCREVLYSAEDCDELIERTCEQFDSLCRTEAFISASLARKSNSTASLAFKDENDKILAEVLYDLYTGTPSSVISDPENDRKIILKLEDVFRTFEKLNSRFGGKEKS